MDELLKNKKQPELWRALLEEWNSYSDEGRLGPTLFQRILESCQSPQQFKILMSSFQSFSHANPHQKVGDVFFKAVDDSPYRLEDWIESLEVFYLWLHEKERGSDLKTMMGYMNCCIESVDSVTARPVLKDILLQMLNTHGFEGS